MVENNIDEIDLEKYLDENPEFAKKYFVQNARSNWVDEWLGRRSHRPSIQPVTNLQKISTSSTDSILRPLINVYPLSKSPTNRLNLVRLYGTSGADSEPDSEPEEVGRCDDHQENASSKNEREGIQSLSEKDLFMQLIRDIANELDINKLSHKILVNVSLLTNGDRCSLFLVKGEATKRYLVSRLFDVTTTSTLEDSLRPEGKEIVIPIGVGIAGTTALTGECINIREAYEDPRFNCEIDKQTGYTTHSILCMPIKSPDGMVIGIAQIINKRSGTHQFTEKDEEVFRDYLTFCGIGITNAQLFELSVQEFKRNQALVSLAKNIFETTEVVTDVVKRIMALALELLDCERCTVYLVDMDAEENEGVVFGQIFNLSSKDGGRFEDESLSLSSVFQGLAAHVVNAQEAMNITDMESAAGEFKIEIDTDTCSSKKVKSMLCTPIFNKENKVIGVAQLTNKRNGHPFTDNDDGLFQAFAIFCGLGIYNTQMYEKVFHLLTKQTLAIELLSYHASAPLEDTQRIQAMEVPEKDRLELTSFSLDDHNLTDDETCLAAIRMFLDLDIISTFKIPYKVVCRWVLTVKRNYRPVIYHNWRHAFNVAQTMYAIFTSGQMGGWFSDLEILVLLVACFCHDLDHRGTNNSFQTKVDSPIAKLYSTSTMEHHHFDQSVMILNSEGNNLFGSLSREQYKEAMTVLKHAILSTDLALYFKQRDCFKQRIESNDVDWNDKRNSKVLRAMLMTACDLSAITKPWNVQVRVAEMVASEFFAQGDIERSQLNLEPVPMMDREKKDELPKMQVGFINFVCMPLYELLPKLNKNLQPLLDGIMGNKGKWQGLADHISEGAPINEMEVQKDNQRSSSDAVKNDIEDSKPKNLHQKENNGKTYEETTIEERNPKKNNGSAFCILI